LEAATLDQITLADDFDAPLSGFKSTSVGFNGTSVGVERTSVAKRAWVAVEFRESSLISFGSPAFFAPRSPFSFGNRRYLRLGRRFFLGRRRHLLGRRRFSKVVAAKATWSGIKAGGV
jgi:hypothetical protein